MIYLPLFLLVVQECRLCHDVCNGCYGPSSGNCLQCSGYQEVDDCVESCSADFYTDELNRKCEPCDHQCLECHGPTASDCTVCRNLKLYDNVEDHTADTPVSDISHCFHMCLHQCICWKYFAAIKCDTRMGPVLLHLLTVGYRTLFQRPLSRQTRVVCVSL